MKHTGNCLNSPGTCEPCLDFRLVAAQQGGIQTGLAMAATKVLFVASPTF